MPTRRAFLATAPLAVIAPTTLLGQAAAPTAASPVPFELITAEKLADDIRALHAAPGNNTLLNNPAVPFTMVLTVEEKKAAKEFEWHEGRDHIVQILEGSTVYELGGTPQSPRNVKPSEWLAPVSTGATTYTLRKGDTLIIPRSTPHKRTTAASVTLTLISTEGHRTT